MKEIIRARYFRALALTGQADEHLGLQGKREKLKVKSEGKGATQDALHSTKKGTAGVGS
jgi:hypothetical protein